MAAAEEAKKLEESLIILTQEEGIADGGNYVFRNFLTGTMQVKTLLKYVVEDLHLGSFTVLHPEGGYGREMAKLFYQEVGKHRGKIVYAKAYKNDHTDFTEAINKLKNITELAQRESAVSEQNILRSFNFDALFIADNYSVVKMIVLQLVFQNVKGIRLPGIGGWNLSSPLSPKDRYLEGAIFTDGFFSKVHHNKSLIL